MKLFKHTKFVFHMLQQFLNSRSMGEHSLKNPQNTLQIFLSSEVWCLFSLMMGKRIEQVYQNKARAPL
jgi:hypothetical protein